jgi:hypothetical protein
MIALSQGWGRQGHEPMRCKKLGVNRNRIHVFSALILRLRRKKLHRTRRSLRNLLIGFAAAEEGVQLHLLQRGPQVEGV